MRRNSRDRSRGRRMSNARLLFLSLILLFIVFEALYVLKNQLVPQAPQVAGVSTEK